MAERGQIHTTVATVVKFKGSSSLFDLHNNIWAKQCFVPTGLTSCLPPRVNSDVAQLWLLVAATPLHPLIAPSRVNQEPSRILLSPSETGAAPSSLLFET
jgi:hypothetical protein